MNSGISMIVLLVVFFFIFYFIAIRPQSKQRRQHQEMLDMLKKGDEVLTVGGIHGTVAGITENWIELEVAKRTRIRFIKRAIASVQSVEEDEEEEEYYEDEVVEDEVIDEFDELDDEDADEDSEE